MSFISEYSNLIEILKNEQEKELIKHLHTFKKLRDVNKLDNKAQKELQKLIIIKRKRKEEKKRKKIEQRMTTNSNEKEDENE